MTKPLTHKETEDWEKDVTLLNYDWAVRLIKFGQAKIPERGFYAFENPYLIPFIEKLLSSQRVSLLKEVLGIIGEDEPQDSTRIDVNIAFMNRNQLRSELRTQIEKLL